MSIHPIILIPQGRATAEVAWPAYERKKGGTCDFMTKGCRENCKLETNNLEQASFEFVEDNPSYIVIRQIIKELLAMKADNVTWWIGSGDCPERLTDKMLEVISELHNMEIPQNGFTRNFEIWAGTKGLDNVRIALTVEKGKSLPSHIRHKGMLISEPEYPKQSVRIFTLQSTITGGYSCGGGYTYRLKEGKPSETFIEDCSLCIKNGVGCYDLILSNEESVHEL